jgi:UDP-glucose 4-epimerase
MKVLVTGGAGFIGNHIVTKLVADGHQVTVLDNLSRGNKLSPSVEAEIELVVGDVRDEATVMRAAKGCGRIFHLAAVLGVDLVAENPVEAMETEVFGTRNVVTAALAHGAERVVYASTSGVYGRMTVEQAVDENASVAPNSSYAVAKRYNEIYLKSIWQKHGLSSVAIRYFNVYGPKQDERMVIPRFFSQAMAGKPLTVFAGGKQTRDFTYIDDVAEATVALGEMVRDSEIVNISYSREYSILELAEAITKLVGSSSTIEQVRPAIDRDDFEVERRFGSSLHLQSIVGFSPRVPLAEGLRRTYDWFLSRT